MRKHKTVRIDAEGRDHGKHFLVMEMDAFRAEKWAMRYMMALGRSGYEMPAEMLHAGMAGVLVAGIAGLRQMAFSDAEPLLDEMLACISFVPDPLKKDPETSKPFSRGLNHGDEFSDGDIMEVSTLLKLRGEAVEIHTGFSVAAALSTSIAAAQTSSRSNTRTSRKSSAPSSTGAKPRSRNSKPSMV